MKNDYVKLIAKLILATVPVLLILLFYVIVDPFQVLYTYNYCKCRPAELATSKDYETTECFINNVPANKYNSFILGGSRSMFYQTDVWKKYIGDSANCFHFDAFNESVFGINKKVLFIDKQNIRIKNALVPVDYSVLSQVKDSTTNIYIKDPILSGGSRLYFQSVYIVTFFRYRFLYSYMEYFLANELRHYGLKRRLSEREVPHYDCITNEYIYSWKDSLIDKNASLFYTPERVKYFDKRPAVQEYSKPVIGEVQISMLKQIEDIFVKDKTKYKIVINPLYDQLKLNPKDLLVLNQIFGQKNVFDFSGKNNWTEDFHNYYEESHYRPNIADSVMKVVYTGR